MQDGGSGRNIAECIARLGLYEELTFITAVGDDDKALILKKGLEKVNIVNILI